MDMVFVRAMLPPGPCVRLFFGLTLLYEYVPIVAGLHVSVGVDDRDIFL